MEIPTSFWVPGFMPMQFLLVFAAAFVLFLAGQYVLKQWGRPVSAFWQGVLIWLTAYGILKWVVNPPLPASLLYTYMGMVSVATFFYVSASEEGWAQCLATVRAFFTGGTRRHRVVRAVVFVALPLATMWGVYSEVAPSYEDPVELRSSHVAPPRTITVHGVRIDLQTAKNPFRVDEGLRPSAGQGS
jgi:hypothetical protein